MSRKITLSEEEQKTIKRLIQEEKSAKIQKRYLFLGMKSRGMRHQDIAEILGVCVDTITDWIQIYESTGVESLGDLHYEGRRSSRLDSHKEAIGKKIDTENVAKLEDLQQWIFEQFQVKTCLTNLAYYCKKNFDFHIKKQGLSQGKDQAQETKKPLEIS